MLQIHGKMEESAYKIKTVHRSVAGCRTGSKRSIGR